MRTASDRTRGAFGLAGLAVVAVGVGKISATRPASAMALVLLPVLLLSIATPIVPLVAAAALLPFQSDNFGAVVAGLRVGPADVLLLFGIGGVAIQGLSGADLEIRRLRPVLPLIGIYFVALTIAWAHLPSTSGIATIVQRIELVIAAAVVGVFVAQRSRLDLVLTGYLVSSGVLAAVTVAYSLAQGLEAETFLGVQKNPAGQVIANGLLIALFHRRVRYRVPFCVLLTLGIIAAQSRGAILATIVALALTVLVVSSSRRVRAFAVIPIIAGVAYVAFTALPQAQQDRLLNSDTQGDVAAETREVYAEDAVAKAKSSPVLGTGVGLYESGDVSDLSYTIDPHNVLLLEAAEGGALLLGAFVLLTAGSVWVLVLRRKDHPLVVVAIAVQVSTVLHGIVDVYWVRGTPVLGWLLVGAALYLAARAQRDAESEELNERAAETDGLLTSGGQFD